MYLMHETYTILNKELVPKGSPVYGKHMSNRKCLMIGLTEDEVVMHKLTYSGPWWLLTREEARDWLDPRNCQFESVVVYLFE